MCPISRRITSIGVGALLVLAPCLPAQEQIEPTNYGDLVRGLASPNARATPISGSERRGREGVRFPAGYDVGAQERIAKARQQLQDHFAAALPFLVNALHDDRYSMTVYSVEEYVNLSVGEVCREIIRSHLELYRDEIGFGGPSRWEKFTYPISVDWYRTRKGRSLIELQVEAIDWAIARRKAETSKEAGSNQQAELAALQKLRDGVVKSGKPVPPAELREQETADRAAR